MKEKQLNTARSTIPISFSPEIFLVFILRFPREGGMHTRTLSHLRTLDRPQRTTPGPSTLLCDSHAAPQRLPTAAFAGPTSSRGKPCRQPWESSPPPCSAAAKTFIKGRKKQNKKVSPMEQDTRHRRKKNENEPTKDK